MDIACTFTCARVCTLYDIYNIDTLYIHTFTYIYVYTYTHRQVIARLAHFFRAFVEGGRPAAWHRAALCAREAAAHGGPMEMG